MKAPTIINVAFLTIILAQTLTGQVPGDTLVSGADQFNKQLQTREVADLEIGELLFDETITKIGKDFYDVFFTNWSNPSALSAFSITVKERPMPGLGTQVRVFINDREIFNSFLQPKMELIEQMANYTVQRCQQFLVNYEQIQAELSSADQVGTGIF